MTKFSASSRSRVTFVALLVALSTALIWFAACSAQQPGGVDNGNGPGSSSGGACDHPNPGCPCSTAGQSGDCGRVELQAGSFVMCSEGKTVCDGTSWGQCVGDVVAVKSSTGGTFGGGGDLHVSALGASAACTNNPCDPYCNQFVDTPGGFDASGFTPDDGGIGITTPPNACVCEEPSTPATDYTDIATTFRGNPASCTGNDSGISTDNCNHDYQCNGGTCSPYTVAGVNASCTTRPDYTAGLSCYDGTNWQLQVCNRGYVQSPGLGTLYIAVGTGTPTGTASACPGTAFPTGPQVSGTTSTTNGYCSINLTTTSIGAGECINVSAASACTSQAGGALDFSGDHWLVVNPSSTNISGTPGASPLPECDSCNNYSAMKATSTGGPVGTEASCQQAICGSVCGGGVDGGADSGFGCHTYVSGTVYDPGGNVFLPGVAVYQPSGALTAFPAGVHCDSCSSILSPFVSSTFSDLTGSFNLEVTGTTAVPVVFQTGRWRRQITTGTLTPCAINNITVPADCTTWPAPNCLTRLPQSSAEGDIPETAVVTGSAEPFECSIIKFMGGGKEIGPPALGRRFQLYSDNGATIWNEEFNTGLNASVSAVVTTTATITGLTGMSAGSVGHSLLLSGANKAKNNGTFLISAYVSPTSVKITNAGPGVSPDTSNGSIFWREFVPATVNTGPGVTLSAFTTPTVTLTGLAGMTAGAIGMQLTVAGGSFSGNNGTFPITAVPSATSVQITNSGANLVAGTSGTTAAVTAFATPNATITGLTGMNATAVGQDLVLSGANKAGNNGSFKILSVTNATTVVVNNSNAVAPDIKNGMITFTWGETKNGAFTYTLGNLPNAQANAFASQAAVNTYDEFVLQCGGGGGTTLRYLTATQRNYFYNFLESGGRLFFDHYSAGSLVVPTTAGGSAATPFDSVSTWNGTIGSTKQNVDGKVQPDGGITTPHANFKTWLSNEGMVGSLVNTPQAVVNEAYYPNTSKTFEWLRGATNNNWVLTPYGDVSLMFSFDTNATGVVPTLLSDGGAGPGCGRSVYSGMHVDTTRTASGGSVAGTTGEIPNVCVLSAGLSDNEKAFEYLMFELSSCAIGGAPIIPSGPPAPVAPPPLVSQTFTRDYHAICPSGTGVVWELFNWQATIPAGTSIVFSAQTAPDVSGSPGTYGLPVPIGTASTTTTGWTTQSPACTVNDHLADLAVYGAPLRAECAGSSPASQQSSLDWLRVSMQFNPTVVTSPVLSQWEQLYDCVPNQ